MFGTEQYKQNKVGTEQRKYCPNLKPVSEWLSVNSGALKSANIDNISKLPDLAEN